MKQAGKLETNARGQRLDHSTSKLGRAIQGLHQRLWPQPYPARWASTNFPDPQRKLFVVARPIIEPCQDVIQRPCMYDSGVILEPSPRVKSSQDGQALPRA
jgi:hypothetical protein